MIKLILFVLIVGVKILLTKGISLVLVLLSFAVKGAALKENKTAWNAYLMGLTDRFVRRFAAAVYGGASLLSALVIYGLFVWFGFSHPLRLALVVLFSSTVLTWGRYRKKMRDELENALFRVKESIAEEV